MKCALFCAVAANRYAIISSPLNGMIYYTRLNNAAEEARGRLLTASELISFGEPRGLSIDQAHAILYVADALTNSIISTGLTVLADGALVAGPKVTVKKAANAVWLAVDSQGNLFYSNPTVEQLMMIASNTARSIFRGTPVAKAETELYSSGGPPPIAAVRAPHGVYADNFHLYWTNSNGGVNEGVLVRAPEVPGANKQLDVEPLQKNVDAGFGVCGSPNSIYYTASGKVFGTRRGGGPVATISRTLLQPRGCQWDGSGAVMVCDKTGNIWQFPADVLIPDAPKQLVLKIADPYDITLFNSARSTAFALALFVLFI